jgi:pyruvate/2-oxoglutarate dehydrogenase complex dihydrolipoamide acyltransferase (E2) component
MQTVKVPSSGYDFGGDEEIEVVEMHVKEGDEVKEGDVLLAIDTEKATVEVESPCDGRVTKIHVAQGDIIDTDASLMDIDEVGA